MNCLKTIHRWQQISRCLFCIILLTPGFAMAQTLVLIPGFQSQGMDWRSTHVASALQERGWIDGGNFTLSRQGIIKPATLKQRPDKVFYTLDLITEARISEQAQLLQQYLSAIHTRRQEPLALVGHSAGGVVARHWLVTANKTQANIVSVNTVPVNTLITIASPHLGTPLAELSSILAGSQEIINLAEALGLGNLPQARGLFRDLSQERPGSYLFWLNRQAHPALRYVSIVRSSKQPDNGDVVVPISSQDMNNVFALRNRTERWETEKGHFLGADDGYLLDWIMAQMKL